MSQQQMFDVSLAEQIGEVKSELEMRGRVYPRLISAGKLTQRRADYQMERMRAVLRTLEWLYANRDAIRRRAGQP